MSDTNIVTSAADGQANMNVDNSVTPRQQSTLINQDQHQQQQSAEHQQQQQQQQQVQQPQPSLGFFNMALPLPTYTYQDSLMAGIARSQQARATAPITTFSNPNFFASEREQAHTSETPASGITADTDRVIEQMATGIHNL